MGRDNDIGAVVDALPTRGRVFLQGAASEPRRLHAALADRPDKAAGLTFVAASVPGLNALDWTDLHPTARGEGVFLSDAWRRGFDAGRYALRSLTYFQMFDWLKRTPLNAAVVMVSPPDASGQCSLGVTPDFAPAILARPVRVLGLINHAMPRTRGPSVHLSRFDAVVECDEALPAYPDEVIDEISATIARRLGELVPDGATIQVGLGKIGTAALAGLEGRRGLKIHSGLITTAVADALDAGIVETVMTPVACGSRAFYDRCRDDARIRFAAVDFTHGLATLANIPRLVAINSALQVDLSGQVNAEFVGGRRVSGIGGQPDFLKGAALSRDGVPIIALPATARGGSLSRIVPALDAGSVSIPRHDVGWIVTEYGSADLRSLDLDARAAALVALAAPEHRNALWSQWEILRRSL